MIQWISKSIAQELKEFEFFYSKFFFMTYISPSYILPQNYHCISLKLQVHEKIF